MAYGRGGAGNYYAAQEQSKKAVEVSQHMPYVPNSVGFLVC
jgi:hypothetical protein